MVAESSCADPGSEVPCPTPSSSQPPSNLSPMCDVVAGYSGVPLSCCGGAMVLLCTHTRELAGTYLWPFATAEALVLRISLAVSGDV